MKVPKTFDALIAACLTTIGTALYGSFMLSLQVTKRVAYLSPVLPPFAVKSNFTI